MADIFQEVDEALKQERIEKLWKEYGPTIIGAAVVIILATASVTGFKSWNTNRNAQETARILEAMDSQDPVNALRAVINESRPGHRTIAIFSAAATALADKNYEQALSIYDQATITPGLEQNFRDLARVMTARLSMMVPETKEASALLDILKPVLNNEESPWIWPARLEAAGIAAHYLHDYNKAQSYLKGFDSEDANIPASQKARAKALSHVYRLKAASENREPQG